MANLLAKSKKYILCFLAAVALIFGVTGTAMLSDGRSGFRCGNRALDVA